MLDRSTKSFVTLNSRNHLTNISNELLEDINEIPGYLGYSINKSLMDLYIAKNVQDELVEELT